MSSLTQGSPLRACVSFLLLLMLGSVTWTRAHVYTNAETLWTDTVTKNPTGWLAHSMLGMLFIEKQDYPRAIASFQIAAELGSQSANVYLARADMLFTQGQFDEALPLCREAVHVDPRGEQGYRCLAIVFLKKGDVVQAAYYQRKAEEARMRTRSR